MQKMKSFWVRMIPAIIITLVSMILSVQIYNTILSIERDDAWKRLEIATTSTAGKIETRITDNLSFMEAVADAYILTQGPERAEEISSYLSSVYEMTIFESMAAFYPDGSIVYMDGRVKKKEIGLSYQEVLALGTTVSKRQTDPDTQREVLYCYTQIVSNGEVLGVLVGTLDCGMLSELFSVATYGEDGQIFLVDCKDGKYILDNWHENLGNIKDLGLREGLNGVMVDLEADMMAGKSFHTAYYSKTNGELTYQYAVPIEAFGWELAVAVQEEVIFAHVNELDDLLIRTGTVEGIVLLAYMLWNYFITYRAYVNEEKARRLEVERASNEAKAKFISNMSHDVRTPINGILGMLHIIKNHRDDEARVDECLEKINISTQYLSTLASDMLDINEIENNQSVVDSIPFDLQKMAEDLETLVAPKAQNSNVLYHMDCSKLTHTAVIGSEVHVQRILVNLIGNAIKYSKDENAHVWLSITELESDGRQGIYKFEIKDNGIGMTEEFQKKMFDAFSQEKITARSNYQGYGLGLTIVSHLVKRLNGKIEIESQKDIGSTFTIILPLTLDNSQKTEDEKEIVSLEGIKILVVEDNEFNMEIAEVLLTDAGAEVTKAYNGRVATEIFAASEEFEFDIVLMDIMMPEMDGCEAAIAIRSMQREDAKTIPIIAMTAAAFTEEINRCKEAGMNEHMTKPLDMDKLMIKVAKYCR